MKCHAVTRYVPGTYVLEYVAINRYRSYMGEYCCLASVEYVTSCSLAGVENVGSRGSPRIILEHLDLLKDHCYAPSHLPLEYNIRASIDTAVFADDMF